VALTRSARSARSARSQVPGPRSSAWWEAVALWRLGLLRLLGPNEAQRARSKDQPVLSQRAQCSGPPGQRGPGPWAKGRQPTPGPGRQPAPADWPRARSLAGRQAGSQAGRQAGPATPGPGPGPVDLQVGGSRYVDTLASLPSRPAAPRDHAGPSASLPACATGPQQTIWPRPARARRQACLRSVTRRPGCPRARPMTVVDGQVPHSMPSQCLGRTPGTGAAHGHRGEGAAGRQASGGQMPKERSDWARDGRTGPVQEGGTGWPQKTGPGCLPD
jgi:hypothetical protein